MYSNQTKMMKNVNLTGLFLAMNENFNCAGFNCNSLIPDGREPIDMMLVFNVNKNTFKNEDIAKVNKIVYEHITGEVKQVNIQFDDDKTNGNLTIYIEFMNSEFIDNLS